MVFHVSFPKPFPPQQRCSLSRFVTAVKGNNFCSNTYKFFGPFTLRFFTVLPNVVTEFTEYKCQSVCVCVHPWTKGFVPLFHWSPLPPFSSTAGGSRVCSWREPTKLQVQTRISKEDALSTYLQPELLTTLSNLLCLIPWFFMLPTPKPFVPPQTCSRRAAAMNVRFFKCACKHC